MGFKYPNISKSRAERLIEQNKSFAPKIVRRKPSSSEGSEGDFAIGNTLNGVRLYVKISNRWYSFSPDIDEERKSTSVKYLAANTTLTEADSDKLFICSQAGAYDITLPAVGNAFGWSGTFVLGTTGANDFDIIGGTTDVMFGAIVGDTNTTINAADKVTFDATNANKGDRIDIVCDGTSYFVTSWADAAADIGASG